jgi:hypothetical protein
MLTSLLNIKHNMKVQEMLESGYINELQLTDIFDEFSEDDMIKESGFRAVYQNTIIVHIVLKFRCLMISHYFVVVVVVVVSLVLISLLRSWMRLARSGLRSFSEHEQPVQLQQV